MTHDHEEIDPSSDDIVGLAEQYLDLALAALMDAASHMSVTWDAEDDEVQAKAQDALAALRTLFNLRTRISDDRHIRGTDAGSTRIDVEEARNTIRSLLDRLRAESSSDEVSQ